MAHAAIAVVDRSAVANATTECFRTFVNRGRRVRLTADVLPFITSSEMLELARRDECMIPATAREDVSYIGDQFVAERPLRYRDELTISHYSLYRHELTPEAFMNTSRLRISAPAVA